MRNIRISDITMKQPPEAGGGTRRASMRPMPSTISRGGLSVTKRASSLALRVLYSARVRAWLRNRRTFARSSPQSQ